MTVTVQTPAVAHVANGITTAFAYAFLVQVSADMIVKVNGVTKTLGADYSISGLGVVAGGMVTFTVAPANGAKVLLYRSIPLSRSNDYQVNGDLPEDLIDADFDRIWMVLQDIASGNSVSGNVLRATVDEDLTEIPSATTRANKYLAFDALGNPIASTAPSGGGAPVSTFMEDVLASADAATAQGLLEVPSETGAGASGTWPISVTGNASTAGTATNLAGGGAGQIPYQAGSGDTDMLAASTPGQILQGNGAAPPTWVNKQFTASGAAPIYGARAFVIFNGTGTPSILASGNVSSITDNGTGDYTINFTTAMPSANYAIAVTTDNSGTSVPVVFIDNATAPTTTAVRIGCANNAGSRVDNARISVTVSA